jgi:hypothetical protein
MRRRSRRRRSTPSRSPGPVSPAVPNRERMPLPLVPGQSQILADPGPPDERAFPDAGGSPRPIEETRTRPGRSAPGSGPLASREKDGPTPPADADVPGAARLAPRYGQGRSSPHEPVRPGSRTPRGLGLVPPSGDLVRELWTRWVAADGRVAAARMRSPNPVACIGVRVVTESRARQARPWPWPWPWPWPGRLLVPREGREPSLPPWGRRDPRWAESAGRRARTSAQG